MSSDAYEIWYQANADWLVPYATFCFLKDMFGTADHREWGALHRDAAATIARLASPTQPFHSHLRFNFWLQWQLHMQLMDAADYARARRVVLKGDLPIGVAKESADTWTSPQLFRMDVGVGSPPDAFDPNGQNWGFPGARSMLENSCMPSLETLCRLHARAAPCNLLTAVHTGTNERVRPVQAPMLENLSGTFQLVGDSLKGHRPVETACCSVQGTTGRRWRRTGSCGGGAASATWRSTSPRTASTTSSASSVSTRSPSATSRAR